MNGEPLHHRFTVIVPVADRPQHLANILASLLELCAAHDHGCSADGRIADIDVIVADDSAGDAAIDRHRQIAREFTCHGLVVSHFGADAQARLWQALAPERRLALRGCIGAPEDCGFRHKGASVTRNLAALQAQCPSADGKPRLFHFVDSDEQFKVRVPGADRGSDEDVPAIDYFGCLDRIFAGGAVEVLTGKVVGDPPVSPAVMAGNFLADVLAFLERIAAADGGQPCTFHGARRAADDAAYHDMADLFGFAQAAEPFDYRCRLAGPHDHARCLAAFAAGLDRFFDGEHPTRIGYFEDQGDCTATRPARTVYTGNYVCTRQGLAHFIPFAPLGLRMAGPTLGRLIRAEIGARFVSANLPLLHTRANHGSAEFRPGVSRAAAEVDLSGEFERQFFGDAMLFTVERLVESGYPARTPAPAEIRKTLEDTEAALLRRYDDKRALTLARLERAAALFDDAQRWWNADAAAAAARADFHRFFANIRRNFTDDARGCRLIHDGAHRAARRDAIVRAIAGYADDRRAWLDAMAAC